MQVAEVLPCSHTITSWPPQRRESHPVFSTSLSVCVCGRLCVCVFLFVSSCQYQAVCLFMSACLGLLSVTGSWGAELVKEDISKPQLSPRGHQEAGLYVLAHIQIRSFCHAVHWMGDAFKCLARWEGGENEMLPEDNGRDSLSHPAQPPAPPSPALTPLL
ncbi:hypothetical protein LEMLEM_LOCUS16415 [Lemmus lemmus]